MILLSKFAKALVSAMKITAAHLHMLKTDMHIDVSTIHVIMLCNLETNVFLKVLHLIHTEINVAFIKLLIVDKKELSKKGIL